MARASRVTTIASVLQGALVLGAPMASAQAQINWARYKPGTIAAVMQLHDSTIRADHVENHPGLIVSGDDFPTLTRVVFKGDSRPFALAVVRFGAYYAGEDITWTFIVNDFKAEAGEVR
jgi:hypothetical protein